jgi:hypothetical protein
VTSDPTPAGVRDDGSNGPWLLGVLLAAIVLVLAPIALVLGLKASRRSQRRTRSDPAAAIAGAWSEAIDDLADRHLSWPPSATPLEVAHQVPPVAGDATATPMQALAVAYGAVRYGDARPSPDAARDAWRHVDSLHHALDASSSTLRRLRARLDPTTLRRSPVRRGRVAARVARDVPSPQRQPDPAGWSKPRSPSTKD